MTVAQSIDLTDIGSLIAQSEASQFGALAVIAILILLLGFLITWLEIRRQRDRAKTEADRAEQETKRAEMMAEDQRRADTQLEAMQALFAQQVEINAKMVQSQTEATAIQGRQEAQLGELVVLMGGLRADVKAWPNLVNDTLHTGFTQVRGDISTLRTHMQKLEGDLQRLMETCTTDERYEELKRQIADIHHQLTELRVLIEKQEQPARDDDERRAA